MREPVFYMDGEWKPQSSATISILDLSVVRGYGVFDYLRTYQGRPFHLQEHLLRLQFSAENLGLRLPYTLEKIEELVLKALFLNAYPESSVKILLTGGISPDQITPEDKPSFAILVYPLKPFPQKWYSQGIHVTTTSLQRPFPVSKTLIYAPAIVALKEAKKQGASEALYLNAQGEILEATTSNFFAFINGVLTTPSLEEVLQGITREIVIKIAKERMEVRERRIPYQETSSFQEAFLVSSNKEIVPIISIDDQKIGSGKPGKRTKELMKLFYEYTRQTSWEPLTIPRYQKSALVNAP